MQSIRHSQCSGLVVDALNGAPGVYSARYAGVGANDGDNNQKLLQVLEAVPEAERTARFICVMVFMEHADDPLFFVPDYRCVILL